MEREWIWQGEWVSCVIGRKGERLMGLGLMTAAQWEKVLVVSLGRGS